mmetsp:Transcript_2224/g.5073  ORF Transcript_2224/g.5073 Transcript_2224/m.5073 type:complete len:279 (-) Transcript_2224:180-1016(-)
MPIQPPNVPEAHHLICPAAENLRGIEGEDARPDTQQVPFEHHQLLERYRAEDVQGGILRSREDLFSVVVETAARCRTPHIQVRHFDAGRDLPHLDGGVHRGRYEHLPVARHVDAADRLTVPHQFVDLLSTGCRPKPCRSVIGTADDVLAIACDRKGTHPTLVPPHDAEVEGRGVGLVGPAEPVAAFPPPVDSARSHGGEYGARGFASSKLSQELRVRQEKSVVGGQEPLHLHQLHLLVQSQPGLPLLVHVLACAMQCLGYVLNHTQDPPSDDAQLNVP